jgi:hypothetical protein
MSYDLGDYVDVKTRLTLALAKWPDLRVMEHEPKIVEMPDGRTFIQAAVTVWRDPADEMPSIAYCFEPYPGLTPYTKNSEQPNASTSALGRALGAMGIGISHALATANEVRNRSAEKHPAADEHPVQQKPRAQAGSAMRGLATSRQRELIAQMSAERGTEVETPDDLTYNDASDLITMLKGIPKQ